MSNKIVQSSGNSECSKSVDQSDNNDPNDDIVAEKVWFSILFFFFF